MRVTLSNRTFQMLQVFAQEGPDFFMRIEEAQGFDQRPFRALLVHRWIVYRAGRGFHITREGRKAWSDFYAPAINRGEHSLTRPLTTLFNPSAYGLAIVSRIKGKPAGKPAETAREAVHQIRDQKAV